MRFKFFFLVCMGISTHKSLFMKLYIWDDGREVTDDQVVRASVSGTWSVMSWPGGHDFKPRSDRTEGAQYIRSESHLNQK